MRCSGTCRLLASSILVCLGLSILIVGCSAGHTISPTGNTPVGGLADLPDLASLDALPRTGAALDNDTVAGPAFLVNEGGVVDGTVLKLEPGSGPAEMEYAIYEIPARPAPELPRMATATVFYADADPVSCGADEGYFLAVGNYGTGGWNVSGPYYKSVVRLPLPPGQVVSPGGNVHLAVIACGTTSAYIVSMQVGYDIGPGWEEHIVSPAQGSVAGLSADIALDPPGNPQIAYVQSPTMIFMDEGPVFIATMDGDGWQVDEVGTTYPARVVQLAIGSNGCRALVLEDMDAYNFHLLWDNDGGNFENDFVIDPAVHDNVTPSVAFCNGADDPSGDLDTAIVVYAAVDTAPNIKLRYLRYDGVALSGGEIIPATRQVARLDAYTDGSRKVRLALPIAPGYPTWDIHFGSYNALVDGWDFGTPGDWCSIDLSPYTDEQMVRAVQTGPGEYAAAFMLQDCAGLRFGLDSGTGFSSKPEDLHYFDLFEDDYEIAAYSDGTVAHLAQGGNYTLGMYRGRPDSGTLWDYQQITSEQLGCAGATFCVGADDSTHFAYLSPLCGSLQYIKIDQFGGREESTVDTGGGNPGMAFGPTPMANAGGDTYLFYMDSARMRLLYSRCRNGMWQEEGVPLVIDDTVLPYMLINAGYLEDTGLLYVVYMDFFDLSISVLSCPAGQNDWHREKFILASEAAVGVADDENGVGIVSYVHNPIVDEGFLFAYGDPRSRPEATEVITTLTDHVDYPWFLDYSEADGHWGFAHNSNHNTRVMYYDRDETGLWGPPVVVKSVPGVGAWVEGAGLAHSAVDGSARLVVHEGPVGPLPFEINVYRELATGGFALEATVTTRDPAAVSSTISQVTEGADGMPVVVAPYRTAVGTMQFEILMPDGPASWISETTWDSDISELLGGSMGYSVAMESNGMPIVAATEVDMDAEMFGIVRAYHYW